MRNQLDTASSVDAVREWAEAEGNLLLRSRLSAWDVIREYVSLMEARQPEEAARVLQQHPEKEPLFAAVLDLHQRLTAEEVKAVKARRERNTAPDTDNASQ